MPLTVSVPESTPKKHTDVRHWYVYKITSPSGRIYIGITSYLASIKSSYKNLNCKKQPLIYKSLLKYGWDAHSFEIIDSFYSNLSFAKGKEMFWIRSHMSNKCRFPDQNGMNLNDGGGTNIGLKMSDEAKSKISLANKWIRWSLESRLLFSAKKKGVPRGDMSPETKKKIALSRIGKSRSEETKIKIGQTRKLRKIPSPTKGVKLSEERKRIIGISKLGNKYSLGKKLSDEHKKKISDSHSIAILQYDLDGNLIKEFSSIRKAVIESGVCKSTIFYSLRNPNRIPKRFIFKYKKDVCS